MATRSNSDYRNCPVSARATLKPRSRPFRSTDGQCPHPGQLSGASRPVSRRASASGTPASNRDLSARERIITPSSKTRSDTASAGNSSRSPRSVRSSPEHSSCGFRPLRKAAPGTPPRVSLRTPSGQGPPRTEPGTRRSPRGGTTTAGTRPARTPSSPGPAWPAPSRRSCRRPPATARGHQTSRTHPSGPCGPGRRPCRGPRPRPPAGRLGTVPRHPPPGQPRRPRRGRRALATETRRVSRKIDRNRAWDALGQHPGRSIVMMVCRHTIRMGGHRWHRVPMPFRFPTSARLSRWSGSFI